MPHSESDSDDAIMRLLASRPFEFVERPRPIDAEERVLWRLPQLLLILYYSRGKRSTLNRLELLMWAIRSQKAITVLMGALAGTRNPRAVLVRQDKSVEHLIALALGEGLLHRNSTLRFQLSTSGIRMVEEILAVLDVFVAEREVVQQLARRVTEGWASSVVLIGTPHAEAM